MKSLPFLKIESLGNDFILVAFEDLVAAEALLDDSETLSQMAQRMCEHHFGIGSDGLLVWKKLQDRIQLRMFNPDGTEDFCGNGLLCVAYALSKQSFFQDSLVIEHLNREVLVRVAPDGRTSAKLPVASFEPSRVPLQEGLSELFISQIHLDSEEILVSAMDTGTTQTVLLVEELPDQERFQRVSRILEHHPFFPARTSVIWAKPLQENQLKIRIWERGVGETLGCGTGSIAVATVWSRLHHRFGEFRIISPGGTAVVDIQEGGQSVRLEAYPHMVFEGKWFFGVR
jgi:diaminopimelate epimerase